MDTKDRTNTVPMENPSFALLNSDGDVKFMLVMPAHSAVTAPDYNRYEKGSVKGGEP